MQPILYNTIMTTPFRTRAMLSEALCVAEKKLQMIKEFWQDRNNHEGDFLDFLIDTIGMTGLFERSIFERYGEEGLYNLRQVLEDSSSSDDESGNESGDHLDMRGGCPFGDLCGQCMATRRIQGAVRGMMARSLLRYAEVLKSPDPQPPNKLQLTLLMQIALDK